MQNTIQITVHDAFQRKCASCCASITTITSISVSDDGKAATLVCQCENGHQNALLLELKEHRLLEENIFTTRTKVSGVTFDNPDGTSRQTLLQFVKPGDSLQIEEGAMGTAKVFVVRHNIGVLGTIRKDVLGAATGNPPELPIAAKVVQVTGGTDEKQTLGCNIELYLHRPSHLCLPEKEGDETAAKTVPYTVYIDAGSREIYHMDKHCSGLKNAKPTRLQYAEKVLKARPCKKCAAKMINEKRE